MRHKDYLYLHDKDFLKEVDNLHLQEQYVKITMLDWKENPLQDIEGKVTGGNLNLDGKSSMRRTCSLSAYIEYDTADVTKVDNLFSLNRKMYLEIGLKNMTKKYPEYDILWFPQGIYVMVGVNISHQLTGGIINLTLKDKMCLLNGDIAGKLPASVQFDEYETIDENGDWTLQRPTIVQIIREAVNHFGGEQLSKIIINDLDTRIKQVVRWRGNNPVYYLEQQHALSMNYSVAQGASKYEYGDDVGYIYTDFTYPGELIGNAGDTICSILDKIKSVLGNYEYFYDIDGNFVWQEIKNYLNTTRATVEIENLKQSDYLLDMRKGKLEYDFDNSNIVISYTNTPQYQMIKNDFIVWGIRKNANGNDIPIRYHLSIDKKPKVGNTYKAFYYTDPDDNLLKIKVPIIFEKESDLFSTAGAAGNFYYAEDTNKIYKWQSSKYIQINATLENVTSKDWRVELYLQGAHAAPYGSDTNSYYAELDAELPKLMDLRTQTWYPEVVENQTDLDYYLDFIDSAAAIGQFSVDNIGRRSHVITDNSINCVFEPRPADFVIIEAEQQDTAERRAECEKRGQKYIQVSPLIYSYLSVGGMYNSAYEAVRDLLYQYTSYNESISLQTMPIFYLEPNTMIGVRDTESNIYGNYMMSGISIPLTSNGTMSINATRALEKI